MLVQLFFIILMQMVLRYGNPNLPCDWTTNPLGNTGLLFDTEDEVWQYTFSQGLGPAEIIIHYIHYNGGYTKYSLSYCGS